MINCHFCGNTGNKVRTHIIPEALYRDIAQDGHALKQRELGKHPKKTLIGVYDEELWCASCEEKYGRFDSYAIKTLRTPLNEFQELDHGYEIDITDPKQLKMFFISLMWRASRSAYPLVHTRKMQFNC